MRRQVTIREKAGSEVVVLRRVGGGGALLLLPSGSSANAARSQPLSLGRGRKSESPEGEQPRKASHASREGTEPSLTWSWFSVEGGGSWV